MTNFIKQVSEWGIAPDTPITRAHHYRLTNILLLLMVTMSIWQTFVFFVMGAVQSGLINLTAPLVFGGGLWLMKSGHTVLARVLVYVISFTAGYAMVAALGPDAEFQNTFLFASAFAVVFFSPEEKWLLWFGISIPLVAFFTLELTDYTPLFGMSRAQLTKDQTNVVRIASLATLWIMMILHFLYIVRDRRKTQEQLVSSEKMVAMGRMAAGIAHEVNNPLQMIVAHAERLKSIAQSNGGGRDQIVGLSEQIQAVAMRIASINKGLLSLSRDAGGDPLKQVSVRSIVQLALDFSRAQLQAQDIELRISDVPEHLTVLGRETQLSQVILNIVNNARDAVLDRPQKWIRIDVTTDSSWVEIAIADSGPGVSQALLPRIFDPFFTTKPVGKGTGLGLSVSQGIMSAHGGQILYDTKAVGARFVIRLPRGPDVERLQRSPGESQESNISH